VVPESAIAVLVQAFLFELLDSSGIVRGRFGVGTEEIYGGGAAETIYGLFAVFPTLALWLDESQAGMLWADGGAGGGAYRTVQIHGSRSFVQRLPFGPDPRSMVELTAEGSHNLVAAIVAGDSRFTNQNARMVLTQYNHILDTIFQNEVRIAAGGRAEILIRDQWSNPGPARAPAVRFVFSPDAVSANTNQRQIPIATAVTGDIKSSLAPPGSTTYTPFGWLPLDGTAYPTGQTDYPALWSFLNINYPAMVAGAQFTLPNMADSALVGAGTLAAGIAGGANAATLVAANLPPHSHDLANHLHSIAHDHASAAIAATTTVTTTATSSGAVGTNASLLRASVAGTGQTTNPVATTTGTVDLPNFTGNSGVPSVNASGNGPGTSTPVATIPQHLRVYWYIFTGQYGTGSVP
jgi:microcystin-dependent protein